MDPHDHTLPVRVLRRPGRREAPAGTTFQERVTALIEEYETSLGDRVAADLILDEAFYEGQATAFQVALTSLHDVRDEAWVAYHRAP